MVPCRRLIRNCNSERAVSLVEYALLIALIAVVVIVVVRSIGFRSSQVFSEGSTAF